MTADQKAEEKLATSAVMLLSVWSALNAYRHPTLGGILPNALILACVWPHCWFMVFWPKATR